MNLYILTIFTILNSMFMILNVSLILYYKYWANLRDKDYQRLIMNMDNDTKLILEELQNTKKIASDLYIELVKKIK